MGNCIERCKKSSPHKEISSTGDQKEKNTNTRVKILLTKDELEWLMSQLQNSEEGKRLGDVLGEIQRSRDNNKEAAAGAVNWRPSLDSIDESPHEVCHEDEDR